MQKRIILKRIKSLNEDEKPNYLVRSWHLTKQTTNILKNAFELAGPSFTALFHTLKLYRLLYFEAKILVSNCIQLLTLNTFSNIRYVYNKKRYGQPFQKVSDKQNLKTFERPRPILPYFLNTLATRELKYAYQSNIPRCVHRFYLLLLLLWISSQIIIHLSMLSRREGGANRGGECNFWPVVLSKSPPPDNMFCQSLSNK